MNQFLVCFNCKTRRKKNAAARYKLVNHKNSLQPDSGLVYHQFWYTFRQFALTGLAGPIWHKQLIVLTSHTSLWVRFISIV